MGKVALRFSEIDTDESIQCMSCEKTISDAEFNSWDDKYKNEPMCEHCFHEQETS